VASSTPYEKKVRRRTILQETLKFGKLA